MYKEIKMSKKATGQNRIKPTTLSGIEDAELYLPRDPKSGQDPNEFWSAISALKEGLQHDLQQEISAGNSFRAMWRKLERADPTKNPMKIVHVLMKLYREKEARNQFVHLYMSDRILNKWIEVGKRTEEFNTQNFGTETKRQKVLKKQQRMGGATIDSDLRNRVIKLAYKKPELREHLLPLVKRAVQVNFFHQKLAYFLYKETQWLPGKDGNGHYVVFPEIRSYQSPFQSVRIVLKRDNNTVVVYGNRVEEGLDGKTTTEYTEFKLSENRAGRCQDIVENFVKGK